jgi:hypothetical protein
MLVAVSALAVSAAVVTSGPSVLAEDGPFDIETPAIVPDAGAENLPDVFGSVKELGPLNSNTTKIGVIHNDAVPTLGLTNPNAQVDLRQAWLDIQTDPGTGHEWLYFGWERDSNNGSGFISIEMMQNPPPAACDYDNATEDELIAGCNPWANRDGDTDGGGSDRGDFFIFWDQQGGSRDLYLRRWIGTAPDLTLTAPALLDATVSEAEYSDDGFRGEAAIDLTATIFGGQATPCLAFANTIPSTVTGNSDTADYKDTILEPAPSLGDCETTTVTTPQDGNGDEIPDEGLPIGTGVVAVQDSAEVTLSGGTATPAGSVAFFLCKVDAPGLCDEDGTSVGSTDLTGTTYPVTVESPTAYVTSAGRYCWRGEYSGDPDNGIPGSSDSSDGECFTVNPVRPDLATTAGEDVFLGEAVADTAALTNTVTQPDDPVINLTGASGDPAGGTITFTLLGPDDCETVATGTGGTNPQDVDVSGNGSYGPVSFTPDEPGTYHWQVEYTPAEGDANNLPSDHNLDCSDANEDVVVKTVPSTLETDQTWVPNDSATVSATAGGNLAGTVSFALYASSDCGVLGGDPAIYSVNRTVAGASPQTVSTANTTAQDESGSFSWLVSYDSTNDAQRDIPPSCHETSALTIDNGLPVSSP